MYGLICYSSTSSPQRSWEGKKYNDKCLHFSSTFSFASFSPIKYTSTAIKSHGRCIWLKKQMIWSYQRLEKESQREQRIQWFFVLCCFVFILILAFYTRSEKKTHKVNEKKVLSPTLQQNKLEEEEKKVSAC